MDHNRTLACHTVIRQVFFRETRWNCTRSADDRHLTWSGGPLSELSAKKLFEFLLLCELENLSAMLEQGQTFDSFTSSRQRREKWSELLLLLMLSSLSSASPVPATDDVSLVRKFEFSAKLQNPCSMVSISPPTDEERSKERPNLIKILKSKVILLNEALDTILKDNGKLKDCSSFSLSQIARVPIAEEILNSERVDALRQFYTSLMNHTAHILFSSHQLEQYSGELCNSSQGIPLLRDSMSGVMCSLGLSIQSMLKQGEDEKYKEQLAGETSRILDEYLVDQPTCSRRWLRDCQAVLSTNSLFKEMSNYLENMPHNENSS